MQKNVEVQLPEKLRMARYPEYIHISRKWFNSQIIFMTVFAVMWNVLLFKLYADMDESTDLFSKLFPLLHVAVGVSISYYALAGWLNKTNVFVSKDAIEINHGPIPWFGNKRFSCAELKQLYVNERVIKNRNAVSHKSELYAIFKDDVKVELLSDFENSEQALFIEQEVENYLGIKNSNATSQ